MSASGSVDDYDSSKKAAIATAFASSFTSISSNLRIDPATVTVTVTAASRRLAELTSAVSRRLQSSGVNIGIEFAPPAGISSSFIATTMEDANTQTAMKTAISAVPGVTVNEVKAVEAAPESGDDPCFPSAATVTLAADGSAKRLDALKEGDEIEAIAADGSATRGAVSLLSISKPDAKAKTFYTLKTDSGHKLNLTAEHHLPVGGVCCSELKQAKDIRVGETVWAVEKAGALVARTVATVTTSTLNGLHSPVLANGAHPIVDGFVTAFDGIRSVRAASYGLSPLLSACKVTGTCAHLKSVHAYLNGRDALADYIGF